MTRRTKLLALVFALMSSFLLIAPSAHGSTVTAEGTPCCKLVP
jgi:hypothetical protein